MTAPNNSTAELYAACEGQYSCSVPMAQIFPLPGCGGDASNYQVVYYRCGDPTATIATGYPTTVG